MALEKSFILFSKGVLHAHKKFKGDLKNFFDNPKMKNETLALMVLPHFYVLNDYKKNITSYLYQTTGAEEELSEEVFWKIVKIKANSFDNLQTSIKKEDGPYKSLISFMNYHGFDKPWFNRIERLTYNQLFSIQDGGLRAELFGGISVAEMVKELGYEKLKVEGAQVKRRKYELDGSYEEVEYDVIYELLKVNTRKLMNEEDIRFDNGNIHNFAIKCWCTSTNEEHYLWVEDQYGDKSPLEGIASTCRIQSDILDDVQFMQRQGDLFLLSFADDFDMNRLDPTKPQTTLDWETYNRLLVAES